MKTLFGTVMVALLIAGLAVPAALGQQKTVKECRDEWRASTDPSKGTQKDYVAKCRGEGTAAAPAAGAKTAKECRDEWRASTDPNKGKQKDYVAKCRGEGTAAAPAAPTAAPAAPAAAAKTAKECRDEWRASTDPNKGTQKDYVAKCRAGETAAAPAAPAAPTAPAAAAAKTAKACRDEWRASTDPNKGTQKDYVAKCRAGETAAAPAAPAAAPSATPPSAAPKTVRACREEWRASTDPAKGTEKDYVAKCHAGVAAAPPAGAEPKTAAPAAPAPASPPAAAAPAPAPPPPAAAAPTPAPAPTAAAPARPAPAAPAPAPSAAAPTGADQYQDEAQAKAHCPADLVVWVNLNSHIYHFSGTSNYGRHFSDKGGAYMCEKDALRETFRAAENEKRP
jgi:hypothetical protein